MSLKVVDNLTNEEHVYYNRKEVPCKKFNVSTPQLLFVSSKNNNLISTYFWKWEMHKIILNDAFHRSNHTLYYKNKLSENLFKYSIFKIDSKVPTLCYFKDNKGNRTKEKGDSIN